MRPSVLARGLVFASALAVVAPARAGFSLYVTTGDNKVVQVDSHGNTSDFATSGLFLPQGIVADQAGNIYVANPIDNIIEAFSKTGVDLGPIAFTGLNSPFPLAIHNGFLFAGNSADGTIEQFTTGGVDFGHFASTGLGAIAGLAFDAQGRLYVGDALGDTIHRYSSTGVDLGVFASTGLDGPQAIAFDAKGRLYAANFNTNTIEQFTANGTDLGIFASTNLSGPVGLAFDPSGDLYVTNTFSGTIEEFAPDGTDLGAFATGLVAPAYLTIESTVPVSIPEPNSFILIGLGVSLVTLGRFLSLCRLQGQQVTQRTFPGISFTSPNIKDIITMYFYSS